MKRDFVANETLYQLSYDPIHHLSGCVTMPCLPATASSFRPRQVVLYHESDLRMVSMFLWHQGKFQRFLQLIQRREKNGYASYFEAALEMPLEKVIPLWKNYLSNVAARRSAIMRLPPSTILNDKQTFQQFTKVYGILVEK